MHLEKKYNSEMNRHPFSGVIFLSHFIVSFNDAPLSSFLLTHGALCITQIKLASVKLARLYMKRVSSELDQSGSLNEPVREFLLLQGVRFAFRVHQVFFTAFYPFKQLFTQEVFASFLPKNFQPFSKACVGC